MVSVEWYDKPSWNTFVVTHSSPASFLQSWEWGQFQQALGFDIVRLAIFRDTEHQHSDEEPLAMAQVVRRALPLPAMGWLYVPRGPVIRSDMHVRQQEIIEWLTEHITTHRNAAVFFRVEPTWSSKENKVSWETLNFAEPRILTHQQNPDTTLLTDISVSNETLLSRMHQKTRYNIRLAARKGVTCEGTSGKSSLDEFWTLLNQTSKHQKIKIQGKSFYSRLLGSTSHDYKETTHNPERVLSIIWTAKHNNKSLATGLWLGFGDTLTYLYGGSTRAHRNVMAPYKLHFDVMQWGRARGYTTYDWWGVETQRSVFKLSGVSKFKSGFGGEYRQFTPPYDHTYQKRTLKYLLMLKKIKQIF